MEIFRHKTAIQRSEFSKPVRLSLEHNLLNTSTSFFDYGCGRGTDVFHLKSLGINAKGWDPASFPNEKIDSADLVNIGYVINVIENASEREHALRCAWELAKKALVVSARTNLEKPNDVSGLVQYQDGFITSRKTFQKFYSQLELREWVQNVIGIIPYPLAPGIFVVFRDEDLRQHYLDTRFRRSRTVPLVRLSDQLYAQHHDLLQPLMDFVSQRGRLPEQLELNIYADLENTFGSIKKAFLVIRRVTGDSQWESIRNEVMQEIRIQLALDRFGGRPKYGELPAVFQRDIKALFSSYTVACEEADELLFSVGDLKKVQDAMQQSDCGKLTGDAFYIHIDALASTPPLLRIYEGCARGYIGQIEGANVIKLRRDKPKVSYLCYPDFDSNPHPALKYSMVVGLQTFKTSYHDYTGDKEEYILHRKEEFISKNDARFEKFAKLTKQEEKAGLYEDTSRIGIKSFWDELLRSKGLDFHGHRLTKRKH